MTITRKKRMQEMIKDIDRYHAKKLQNMNEKERERVNKIYEEIMKGGK